jgi:hypothetical protein
MCPIPPVDSEAMVVSNAKIRRCLLTLPLSDRHYKKTASADDEDNDTTTDEESAGDELTPAVCSNDVRRSASLSLRWNVGHFFNRILVANRVRSRVES